MNKLTEWARSNNEAVSTNSFRALVDRAEQLIEAATNNVNAEATNNSWSAIVGTTKSRRYDMSKYRGLFLVKR